MDPTTHRAYFFGNMYLSSIQQGIQAAHVVTKWFAHYHQPSVQKDLLMGWAEQGVTKVLLQGGPQSVLEVIFQIMDHVGTYVPIPVGCFYESQEALNGALTSVGVVVPQDIYALELDVETFWAFCERAQVLTEEQRKKAFEHPVAMQALLPYVNDESSARLILFYLLRWGKLAS